MWGQIERERERLIPGNRLNYSRVRNRIMAEARIWLSRVWLTNAAQANRFIVSTKSCFNSNLRVRLVQLAARIRPLTHYTCTVVAETCETLISIRDTGGAAKCVVRDSI